MRGYQILRPPTAFTVNSRYRRPRRRSDLHLKWIRTLPCAICGKQGNIHAAHLRAASLRHGKLAIGIAQKLDDSWTTPLCPDHHLLVNPFVLALALWRASGDDEAGFLILHEMADHRGDDAQTSFTPPPSDPHQKDKGNV